MRACGGEEGNVHMHMYVTATSELAHVVTALYPHQSQLRREEGREGGGLRGSQASSEGNLKRSGEGNRTGRGEKD